MRRDAGFRCGRGWNRFLIQPSRLRCKNCDCRVCNFVLFICSQEPLTGSGIPCLHSVDMGLQGGFRREVTPEDFEEELPHRFKEGPDCFESASLRADWGIDGRFTLSR